jgi:hypothetical protein
MDFYCSFDESELACCLYCTKNGWRCIALFSPGVGVKFAQSSSQWETNADT